jgi:ribosomal protein S18 acetylase RimI-like enzyme
MIRKANKKDAATVARLHFVSITEGFLPKLGQTFLKHLYTFLIRDELVLVWEENEKIAGFISCALDTGGLMKRFLLKSPGAIVTVFIKILSKPSFIIPLLETYKAPSKSDSEVEENNLPSTELLSISVHPEVQQTSVGTKLLTALESELLSRGIKSYKVVAGESLLGANRFYQKNGFRLIKTIEIHIGNTSNVYIKDIALAK